MDKDILIKRLTKKKWWVEEAPGVSFLFDYIMKTFVYAGMITGYPTLSEIITIKQGNIALEITPYEEKIKNFEFLLARELKQSGSLEKRLRPWAELRRQLIVENRKAIGKLPQGQEGLYVFLKNFFELSFNSVIYGAFIECVDPFTELYEKSFATKYKLDQSQAIAALGVLTTPAQRSFLTQEKLDFYQLCLGKIKMNTYQQRWFWIRTNYSQSRDLSVGQLRKEVNQELKHGRPAIRKKIEITKQKERKLVVEKKSLLRQLQIDDYDRVVLDLITQLARYIDLRKESMLRNTYARDKLLVALSRRLRMSRADLRKIRDWELLALLSGKEVDWNYIRKRDKGFVTRYTEGKEEDYVGSGAKEIYNRFIKASVSGRLSGMVASSPMAEMKGRVSVVLDVNTERFTPGSILVTTMTRPEFLPLLRKASAIITDEGGITCHAAIVSRELHIPCIIGTKSATKQLKNGDRVRLDLKTGIIVKI